MLAINFTPTIDDDWLVDDKHRSKRHYSNTLAVLNSLKADQEIISLYSLFHALRTKHPQAEARLAELDKKQRQIIDELFKIYQADWWINPKTSNAEGFRRLLFAMINDVRLVLILLAEQLVLMRAAIKQDLAWQQQLANATMTYHAALANRLGVWQIKWELEDLSFRALQPEQYRKIANKLIEKREDREQFIKSCSTQLIQALSAVGINADIAGRPKHIYSIYRKMQKKNLSFEGLFDIRAVRVLVDTVADCYAALGIVHGQWPHVPKEFDDYIAQPKGNMYQSLHTVVMIAGKTLEVQIRTHQMHEHAELGVAAHWRYKDGSKQDSSYDSKVNWMRQLLSEHAHADDLLNAFQADTSEERVYVFTPNGDIIDLPYGSTSLDFAYHVHTEVGHRCQGAKVNGVIVPLTKSLQTGDRVEILTAKNAKPSRDWLHEQSGYLHSNKARAKVRHWFRENDFDRNQQIGKEMLEQELKKYALRGIDMDKISQSFNLQQVDKLYAMVGTGDITTTQVLNRAEIQIDPQKRFNKKTPKKKAKQQKPDIIVDGIHSLKTTIAACCQPKAGDAIGGYITRTRGISVHKIDCDNYLHMISEDPGRLVSVVWSDQDDSETVVVLTVTAYDNKGLIKDISVIIANQDASITALDAHPDKANGWVKLNINLQVKNFSQLSQIVNRIESLEYIIEIHRTA